MTTENNAAPSGLTDECAEAWNEYRRKCCEQRDELPDIADFFAGWDAALLATAPKAAEQAPVAGWKLVPLEPTQTMLEAGGAWLDTRAAAWRIWTEMLAAAPQAPVADAARADWRELCRRLYVELFHCDQQMRSTRDEEGEPHWTQSTVVRDVLRDARAALDATPTQQSARASEAPYSAPFTTDVPHCCGDPSTCNDPCGEDGPALDVVKPAVDEWIRSRGTYLDGEAYYAALELAAFVTARASEAGEAVAWIDGKTLAGFNDAQNAHATIAVNLRRGEAAYDTDVPLYLDAPAQQAVTLSDDARDAFIRKVAAQKPEKPDHWSSCGQCQHNAEEAQDLLDAVLERKGDQRC